jgi:hypothetical protein
MPIGGFGQERYFGRLKIAGYVAGDGFAILDWRVAGAVSGRVVDAGEVGVPVSGSWGRQAGCHLRTPVSFLCARCKCQQQ